MSILSNTTDKYFGLDIGNTGIRVVQVQGASGNPALVTYADAALPVGLLTSDSPIDHEKIASTLKQIVKDAKIDTLNVVAGIPSAQSFSTVITTPKLSSEELAGAMKLQADQHIPMAVDQVKMDWHVIGPGKDETEMRVLLVAAPNTVVNKYLNIVQKAGLELQALEVNALALTRSLLPPSDLAVVVLDVGSLATDIAIVHQKAPQLIRSVQVGGEIFFRAVGQDLGLDAEQAEQFTKKFGLTKTKLEGQVLKAVKPTLDILNDEIQKSVKFFAQQNPDVKLEKIVITGGTTALPELTTYIANATGLPVELGNPWVNISYPAAMQQKLLSLSLQYGVAAGLALRAYL